MPIDVVMPQMGESIFEGTITKWLKKAGDAVEKDEPLFEISTDKVDAEIPSPAAGVLSEIKIGEGATVEVNTVVAVIADSSAQDSQAVAPASAHSPAQTQETKSPAAAAAAQPGRTDVVMPQMGESIFEGTITKWLKKVGDAVEKDEPLFEISTDKVDAEIPSPVAGVLTAIKVGEGETVQINTVVAAIGGDGTAEEPSGAAPEALPSPMPAASPAMEAAHEPPLSDEPIRSSPLVRRMAREHGLDLRRIRGTGSAGRINKEDMLRFLEQRDSATPTASAPSKKSAPPQVALPRLEGKLEPMSRMRTIIAQRMVESRKISPHAYTVYKVDMTRVVRLRDRNRASFEQRHGVKLTYMPFIAAAAVDALRQFPIVNAAIEGESIRYHANVNLGIAVALEWGLIVPVIREAEGRGFGDLAAAIGDLAGRARAKKLKPEEASGSTFTLTNSGVFGGEFGTPILNQPEAAILAIGGLRKEPVVLTDAEGNDSIAIRSMQTYCLGFDHRIVDGADAGKFMTAFKNALENWDRAID